MNPYIWLGLAAALVGLAWQSFTRERFQPEFLDKTQEKVRLATEDSSYEQWTNHVQAAPYNMGPIPGIQTPFQVNQYKAYVL
jgi:hypothetical protein